MPREMISFDFDVFFFQRIHFKRHIEQQIYSYLTEFTSLIYVRTNQNVSICICIIMFLLKKKKFNKTFNEPREEFLLSQRKLL